MTSSNAAQKVVALHSASAPLSLDNLAAIDKSAQLGSYSDLRKKALTKLSEFVMPTMRDELWRFTNPDSLKFEKLQQVAPCTLDATSSESGVTVLRGAEALACGDKLLSGTTQLEDVFSLCSAASLQNALSITVKKNTAVAQPIELNSLISATDGATSSVIFIEVQTGASVKFLEDLATQWSGLSLAKVVLVVRSGAKALFTSLQRYASTATYYGKHHFIAERDAQLKTLHVALGAKASRLDIDLELVGPGASVDLLGLVLADGKRHVDFHPNQIHLAPHCRSDLYLKTVVAEKARSVYYGYIKVAEGAQKTDAYQTNRNLLLSESARADTIPNLEIKANDVKCSHGASVSHVGLEDLFYLMARGIPRSAAVRLLVEGFLQDVLFRVGDDGLQDRVSALVAQRLDQLR